MDDNNILVSVALCTRKRPKLLSENLSLFYDLSSFPHRIETLIRIDDDDLETEEEYRNNGFFKKYRDNIKMFKGPRIGYAHQWKLLSQLMGMGKGCIIVPFADDCLPQLKNWDLKCLAHKEKAVVLGSKSRMIFTKKLLEKYDIFRNYAYKTWRADDELYRFAISEKIFIKIEKWYKRLEPQDVTHLEGACGKWQLKDLSILDNLTLTEVTV